MGYMNVERYIFYHFMVHSIGLETFPKDENVCVWCIIAQNYTTNTITIAICKSIWRAVRNIKRYFNTNYIYNSSNQLQLQIIQKLGQRQYEIWMEM